MGKFTFEEEHRIITESINRRIAQQKLLKELAEKHVPLDQNQGAIGAVTYCVGCKTPGGLLNTLWPCDVVKLVEASK
jgi:hypothetical protein